MKPGTRSTACLALVRAFCPGAASSLRECREKDWSSATFTGIRVEVEYDLPDEASRKRAFELLKLAEGAAGADIPVRGWMFTEVEARVRGDRLHVEGVAIRD
jgi:hypothetical protein